MELSSLDRISRKALNVMLNSRPIDVYTLRVPFTLQGDVSVLEAVMAITPLDLNSTGKDGTTVRALAETRSELNPAMAR
jgi:hypothetical protein